MGLALKFEELNSIRDDFSENDVRRIFGIPLWMARFVCSSATKQGFLAKSYNVTCPFCHEHQGRYEFKFEIPKVFLCESCLAWSDRKTAIKTAKYLFAK